MIEHTAVSVHALSRKKSAIRWSIFVGILLMIVKTIFSVLTNSMSVAASAIDSLLDVFVSSVNYISLREASKPADDCHAYGHGKIESLAGLFQSIFISLSGLFLIYESLRRLVEGVELERLGSAIYVMIFSTLVTFLLVKRLSQVASETQSIIVGTEKLHFLTDIYTNLGVIAALLLVKWSGLVFWDLLIALLIAGYVLRQSFGIMRNAIDELIDRALPANVQDQIRNIILSHDSRVKGIHNLRTRRIGDKKFIEFHVEIDKNMSFENAHNLTEDLIEKVKENFPNSDVNAHFDPQGGR